MRSLSGWRLLALVCVACLLVTQVHLAFFPRSRPSVPAGVAPKKERRVSLRPAATIAGPDMVHVHVDDVDVKELRYEPWFAPWPVFDEGAQDGAEAAAFRANVQEYLAEDAECRKKLPEQGREKPEQFLLCHPRHSGGQVEVLHSGVYVSGKLCGMQSPLSDWIDTSYSKARVNQKKFSRFLSFLVVGEGGHLQHWLPDVMPKFALLKRAGFAVHDMQYLMHRLTHGNIRALMERGNFSFWEHDTSHRTAFTAEQLVLPCRGPFLNPVMFEETKKLFHIGGRPRAERRVVVYCSRAQGGRRGGGQHPDRHVQDEEVMLEQLERMARRHDMKVVVFEASQQTLSQTIELFEEAAVVVGPHGGALFNAIFAPPHTRVVELFAPTLYPHVGGRIVIWLLSALLHQPYTRFSCDLKPAAMLLQCGHARLIDRVEKEIVAFKQID